MSTRSKASTQQEALAVQHMCRQAPHAAGTVVRGVSCMQGPALLLGPPCKSKSNQKLYCSSPGGLRQRQA